MALSSTTLRPGLLVGLSTSVTGNVKYLINDVEGDHVTPEGKREAEWNTRRVIDDPAEFELATKARSRVRTLIAAVCAKSAFGLLCPLDKVGKLEEALAEARKVAEDFNFRAGLTQLKVRIITGKIAEDDVAAVQAINGEVRELLVEMEEGVRNLDPERIRKAANTARQLGTMLSDDAQRRIQDAITAVRNTATKIVAAGEQATVEIDRVAIASIMQARTAFLDYDDGVDDVARPDFGGGRAVDLMPADEVRAPRAAQMPAVEMA